MSLEKLPHDLLSTIFGSYLHWIDVIRIQSSSTSIHQFVLSGVWCRYLNEFYSPQSISTKVIRSARLRSNISISPSVWFKRFNNLIEISSSHFSLHQLIQCLQSSRHTLTSVNVNLLPLNSQDWKSFHYWRRHYHSTISLTEVHLFGDSQACALFLCCLGLSTFRIQQLEVLPTSVDLHEYNEGQYSGEHTQQSIVSICVDLLSQLIKSNSSSLRQLHFSSLHLNLWSLVFSSLHEAPFHSQSTNCHYSSHNYKLSLEYFRFSNVPVSLLPHLPRGSSVDRFIGGDYTSVDNLLASHQWLSSHYRIKTLEIGSLVIDLLIDTQLWNFLPNLVPILHYDVHRGSDGILSDGFNPTITEVEDSDLMYISVPNSLVSIYTGGLLNANHLNGSTIHFRLIPEETPGDALRSCVLWTQKEFQERIVMDGVLHFSISRKFPIGTIRDHTNINFGDHKSTIKFFELLNRFISPNNSFCADNN